MSSVLLYFVLVRLPVDAKPIIRLGCYDHAVSMMPEWFFSRTVSALGGI